MSEYFRDVSTDQFLPGRSRTGTEYINYTAYGKPFKEGHPHEGRFPTAEVTTSHTFAKYGSTFDNKNEFGEPNSKDVVGASGLHPNYLDKTYGKLNTKSNEGGLTPEETDAHDALRVLRGWAPHSEKNQDKHQDYRWALDQTESNVHIAPTQLFHEIHPARTTVHRMFADPAAKAEGINLMGIAYREHSGTPFVASDSLSKHSSKLVQNAVSRGLPVTAHGDNPTAEQTNDIDEDGPTPHNTSPSNAWSTRLNKESISPFEVAGGKAVVREMLGKKRNAKPVTQKGLSDQFLPGMEGFS